MATRTLEPHGRAVLIQPRLDARDVLEGGPGVLATDLDAALRDEHAPSVSGLRVAHQAEARRAVRKHRSVKAEDRRAAPITAPAARAVTRYAREKVWLASPNDAADASSRAACRH